MFLLRIRKGNRDLLAFRKHPIPFFLNKIVFHWSSIQFFMIGCLIVLKKSRIYLLSQTNNMLIAMGKDLKMIDSPSITCHDATHD